ncbi:MAG: dTMP kinase, partial [Gemmataceae bacterium]|nr:dTMP kinase [Gemmataceae bacterium]
RLLLEYGDAIAMPCEALLFMASRAQLVAEVIRPSLQSGATVVCDRFLLANVVYQGHAGGLDPEALWNVGRLATEGLEPDLTFVLDLPVDEAQRRRRGPPDRLERRGADFFHKVRDGFLAEARRRPGSIVVVDATAPIDTMQSIMRDALTPLLAT